MSSCLNVADFERFDVGNIDEAAARRISDHLSSCESCRSEYERFRADQSFLRRARPLLSSRSQTASDPTQTGSDSRIPQDKHFPRMDGYRIIDVLGQGGMGIVYRAVQMKLSRTVALKVLPAVIGAASPSAVSRFRREAHSAARLHHTNIVPIYDFGESHGGYYYAMELITGQPLSVLVRRFSEQNAASASPTRLADLLRRLTSDPDGVDTVDVRGNDSSGGSIATAELRSPGKSRQYFRQVARWIADAADALHYAHGEGIIHRDIKPANILLSAEGRIMIGDFGLAKSADEETLTMTGSLLGTVRYLSPEQAMARRVPVDHRTDIYSLGATMYELLTFQPVFVSDDDKQILSAIITKEPVAPHKIIPSVPAELETICLKTLEKSPDARYDTARAMAEDLRRFISDLPIIAKRPGPLKRALKFARRRKALVTAVAAMTLFVAACVGLVVVERQRKDAETTRLLDAGRRALKDNDFDKAEELFTDVLRLDPQSAIALGNIAIAKKDKYVNQPPRIARPELLAEADDYFHRAIELAPDNDKLWNYRGVSLYLAGRLTESQRALEKAIALNPALYSADANLGRVLAMKGKWSLAREHAMAVTRLDPDQKFDKFAVGAWRTLGTIQMFLNDAGAIESLENAKKCESDNKGASLLLARYHLMHKGASHVKDALFHARNAREHSALEDGRVQRVSAHASLRNGDYRQALDFAREAIRMGDLAVVNHLLMAVAHARLGEFDRARAAMAKAEATWPDDLRTPGAIRVNADRQILWFDLADELFDLRADARHLLDV